MAVFIVSGAPFLDLLTCFFSSVVPLLISADSNTIYCLSGLQRQDHIGIIVKKINLPFK